MIRKANEGMDWLEILIYLFQRKNIIAACAILGTLVMAVYSFILATPIYKATALIYVVNSRDSVLNLSDLQIGTYLTSDYRLVFNTWEVNQQVIMNLELPYTVRELRNMIYITNPSDTRALFINVESHDAQEAADIANEFASVACNYISDVMLAEKPTLFSMALPPSEPAKPQKLMNVMVGFAAGLFLSVVLLSIVFVLDDRIVTPTDLEKYTGMAPIAVIPVIESRKKENDWN